MAPERIGGQFHYQVCLHLKQVTCTAFFLWVPHKKPSGPASKKPKQAFKPLKPFLAAKIWVEPHLGQAILSSCVELRTVMFNI